MKHNHLARFLALALLLLGLVASVVVLAQTSAGFDLEWHVTGSGGGNSASASYQVNGTIGQSIASQPAAGSASFKVSSGYWFVDTVTGTPTETPSPTPTATPTATSTPTSHYLPAIVGN